MNRLGPRDPIVVGSGAGAEGSGMSKVSIDEKSARTIARGRIEQLFAFREEQLRKKSTGLPQKRNAWLRAIEREIQKVMGESLLLTAVNKRDVFFVCLDPWEERPGWLWLTGGTLRFQSEPWMTAFGLVSAHAIARLMERKREVDPLKALSSELLEWTFAELIIATLDDERDFAMVPTRSGYFTAEKDRELIVFVLTTWLPDRLLRQAQVDALAILRREGRLQYGRELEPAARS